MELLEAVINEVSKLVSRGFKEVPVVCATGVDWVVIVCFLLKMNFSQPPFCGGAACLKIVTGRWRGKKAMTWLLGSSPLVT